MRQAKRAKALRRPVPVLAVLVAALVGCGGDPGPARARYGGYYGGWPGYYGGSGYYGSPYYGSGLGRYGGYHGYGPRGYYRGGGFYGGRQPRTENWSQDRLRQHWIEQARRAR